MANCRIGYITAPECVEQIFIPTGITDIYGGDYKLVLTDRFGNKYTEEIEIEDGIVTLDTSLYPIGLFTKYSGNVKIEVLNGCDAVDLEMCDVVYGYYLLSFYSEQNTPETFEICCS